MVDDPKRGDGPPKDPFDEWRERMREDPFLGPFFSDIDREFERMRESLSKMLQGMSEGMEPGKDPFVYGFSVRMGPDGKPRFREFGNVKPGQRDLGPDLDVRAREPMVDVQESEDHITITAELPGVEKEDIKVRAKEHEVLVQVTDGDRRYFKRVDLPAAIKTDSTQATYKNGVLDIEVEKAEPGPEDEGTEVPIE